MAKQQQMQDIDLKRADEGRVYEVSYLIDPLRSEDEAEQAVAAIRERIEQKGGSVHHTEALRFIDLAYQIELTIESKKHRYDNAYFGWMVFTTTPPKVVELKRELKKQANVIRSLVIKRDEHESEQFSASTEVTEDTSTPSTEDTDTSGQGSRSENEPRASQAHTSGDAIDEAIEELVP